MYWLVNEKSGKAERVKDEKPPTGLLDLLLTGEKQGKFDASQAKPGEKITCDGVEYLVYHVSVKADEPIEIDAFVRADNKRLHSLQAKRTGKPAVLAELHLVSINEPLPEDKFAILSSLSEDGRVGKVADVQGVVTVKPLNAERWTVADDNLVLMPGDYLRTDNRGANAVDAFIATLLAMLTPAGQRNRVCSRGTGALAEHRTGVSGCTS